MNVLNLLFSARISTEMMDLSGVFFCRALQQYVFQQLSTVF